MVMLQGCVRVDQQGAGLATPEQQAVRGGRKTQVSAGGGRRHLRQPAAGAGTATENRQKVRL